MIGRALAARLQSQGHSVQPLSRPADWDPEAGICRPNGIGGASRRFAPREHSCHTRQTD